MFAEHHNDKEIQEYLLKLSSTQFQGLIPSFIQGKALRSLESNEDLNAMRNMDILDLLANYYDCTSDHINEIFYEYDKNDTGFINTTDLYSILKTFHIRLVKSEYENMIQYLDNDNKGEFDKLHFLLLVKWLLLYSLFKPQTIECILGVFTAGSLSVCNYNKTKLYYESPLQNQSSFFLFPHPFHNLTYINISSIDPLLLCRLATRYSIHPLVIEDILLQEERTKIERYNEYLYLSFPTFSLECTLAKNHDYETKVIPLSHITGLNDDLLECLVQGSTPSIMTHMVFVIYIFKDIYNEYDEAIISFQNDEKDTIWSRCISKLSHRYSKSRTEKGIFLVHTIIDIIVDRYIPILKHIHYIILYLDSKVNTKNYKQVITQSMVLSKEIEGFQRRINPLQDILASISQSYAGYSTLQLYIRDISDHLAIVHHSLTQLYESCQSIKSLALSSQNKRLTRTVTLLTFVTTVFTPLSFLAGVYGMNFDVFPEIHWEYGYLMFWVLSITIIIILVLALYYFYYRN